MADVRDDLLDGRAGEFLADPHPGRAGYQESNLDVTERLGDSASRGIICSVSRVSALWRRYAENISGVLI